jgi:hypothetical protein
MKILSYIDLIELYNPLNFCAHTISCEKVLIFYTIKKKKKFKRLERR